MKVMIVFLVILVILIVLVEIYILNRICYLEERLFLFDEILQTLTKKSTLSETDIDKAFEDFLQDLN